MSSCVKYMRRLKKLLMDLGLQCFFQVKYLYSLIMFIEGIRALKEAREETEGGRRKKKERRGGII